MGKRDGFARLLPSGIIEDLRGWEIEVEKGGLTAWSGGANVRFTDSVTQSAARQVAVFGTPVVPPLFAMDLSAPDGAEFIYAGLDQIYSTDGSAHHNITPASGWTSIDPRTVSGTILNHIGVLNHNPDVPIWYAGDPSIPFAPLPGWPADWHAQRIIAYRNFLVAINIEISGASPLLLPDWLAWSSSAAPGEIPQEWTPSPTNDAGDLSIGDAPGRIVAGEGLADSLMLYKSHSSYMLTWVGGQSVMSLRKTSNSVGALSGDAVCSYGGVHWIVMDGDIVAYDGQAVRSIASRKVRRAFFSELGELTTIQFMPNPDRGELMLFYGVGGDGDQASRCRLYDVNTGLWGRRDLAPKIDYVAASFVPPVITDERWIDDLDTWASSLDLWGSFPADTTRDAVVTVNAAGFIALDQGDGQDIWVGAKRESLDMGSPELVKVVKRLTINANADLDTTVEIRAGGQMQAADPVSWSPWVPIALATESATVWTSARGRLLSIEWRASGLVPVRVSGFDVAYSVMGQA